MTGDEALHGGGGTRRVGSPGADGGPLYQRLAHEPLMEGG